MFGFKPKKPKTEKEIKLQKELNEAFSYVRTAFLADGMGIPHAYKRTRYEYSQKLINTCKEKGMLPWWSEDDDKRLQENLIKLVQKLKS